MGGIVLGKIGSFIAALFVGAAGASPAYIFAVNIARIAALALIAKVTAPKLDLSRAAVEKLFTSRNPIAPQTFMYGEDMVSGPLIYSNLAGNDGEHLFMTVALLGHEADSIIAYRVDDEDIALGDLSGAVDGTVDAGKFNGVAEVGLRLGTSTQAVFADLNTHYPTLFTSFHTGRGWTMINWRFTLVKDLDDAFGTGIPQNLRALLRGYKVYDPRLDTTNGGTGPHRLADDTTWEWSHNPALCLAHFILNDKFGMREEDDRVDWPLVITAADICEELVAIPTAATQERYTCNATFQSTEKRGDVRTTLLGAMMGRMVFSQGKWRMWAGAAITPNVTLTEANLAGAIQLQASTGSKERYNRVRGRFVDANRDYAAQSYPEQRSSTYVTADGEEVRELVADFLHTNNTYEAQRQAIITLKQSRNQRVVIFQGNWSCFRIQTGTTVLLDIAEYGFAGEKFFVTEWSFGQNGVELTLLQEVDSVWADPLEGDYTERLASGALVFGETGVPAPTAFAGVAELGGFHLTWTNPPSTTIAGIEIWASFDNVRANAVVIATVLADEYTDRSNVVRIKYYWIRAVNSVGQFSVYTPNLTTTTISGNVLHPLNPPDFAGTYHYDDLDTTGLAAGAGRYAMLTARATDTSGDVDNFQNTDAILINAVDTDGIDHTGFFGSLLIGERLSFVVSNDRWYLYDIDAIYSPIGSGATTAYKFGVTLVHQHDIDPDIDISTAAGADVNFEFQRFEPEADGVLVRDPDFDLSTAIGDITTGDTRFGFFWYKSYTLLRTQLGNQGGVAFNPAGGGNGSNSILLENSDAAWDTTGGFADEDGALISTRRIRTNIPQFTVKIRWRNNTANDFPVPITVQAVGYDDPRAGTIQATAVGDAFDANTTGTTWQETVLRIDGPGDPDAQYYQIQLIWSSNYTTTPLAAECDIDSIFVYASDAVMSAATASVASNVGLVPSAAAGDETKYLKADATWGDPPGGSASDSYKTHTVIDVDSGYTWAATGSAIAASPTDTLEYISGVGIDIDVDAASDAIRITATGAVSELSDLSDVNTSTPTNRFALVADGVDFESRLLVELDISDFGSYSLSSHTHVLTAGATDVTALAAEVNLLDLSGLTIDWVLSADSATTASWKAQTGNVTKVGTPVNNELGVWTGDGTLEGDTNLTWDGAILTINGTGVIDDGAGTPQPIGYNTLPIFEVDVGQAFDEAHQGMLWHKDANASLSFTCNNVAGIDQGATWFVHNADTEDVTIAQGAGVTVYWLAAGDAPLAGAVVVKEGGFVTVYKYTDTEYWVWGAKEGSAAGVTQLSNLSDVNTSTPTNRFVLVADGVDFESRLLIEADISDLGTYSVTSHTHLLATGATDITALPAEVNLLDLAGLTTGWVLSADSATTASWKAQTGGGGDVTASGSPLNNEIAVFTGSTDIDSDATFSWDGTTQVIGDFGTANEGHARIENDLAEGSIPLTYAGRDDPLLIGEFTATSITAHMVFTRSGYSCFEADGAGNRTATWLSINGASPSGWNLVYGATTSAGTVHYAGGTTLRVESTAGIYVDISHDATDLNVVGELTTSITLSGLAGGISVEDGGGFHTSDVTLNTTGLSAYATAAGGFIDVWGAGTHDLQFIGVTGKAWFRDGCTVRISDVTLNTSYVEMSHDLNDFSIAGFGAVDINITGYTSIQAGTVAADFGAITGTSYGGIAEGNLYSEAAANVQTAGSLTLNDNIPMYFGTGQDSFIDNNGSQLEIWTGSHTLLIRSSGAPDPENMATFSPNGQVALFYDGTRNLATQSNTATGQTTGVKIRHHDATEYDAGLNLLPAFNFNASDTLEASHCGMMTGKDNTTITYVLTGPTSSDLDFPVGGVCTVANFGTTGVYTLNDTATCTMRYCDGNVAPADIVGAGTLDPGGIITLYRYSSTAIYIFGTGFNT